MRFLVIVFLLNSISVFSQKHDSNWLIGGSCITGSDEHILTQLDFRDQNFQPQPTQHISYVQLETNSIISNSLGDLMYYTNGNQVNNWKHEPLLNGEYLLFDSCYYENIPQGAISMPTPDFQDQYVLITINAEIIRLSVDTVFVKQKVYFNSIDMLKNEGEGEMLIKQDLMLNDTLNYGQGMVCQHANGRDWWLLLFEQDSKNYYRFLVDPTGYHSMGKQEADFDVITGRSQVAYSPDGAFYATYNFRGGSLGVFVDIFRFDRCDGILEDQIHINLFDMGASGGLVFSPNSRFLYAAGQTKVLQYDLWAEDVEASAIIVAVYDGFLSDGIAKTEFHSGLLAADNKIYFTTPTDGHFMHVIHNPNEKGIACNFEQHGLEWPVWKHTSIPNFPHYRMGPLAGSFCDTLGLINSPFANFIIEDLGTSMSYQFEDRSTTNVEEWLWDFGDGNISSEEDPMHEYIHFGSFTICLTVSNEAGESKKCQSICVLPEPDAQEYISASGLLLDCGIDDVIDLSTPFVDLDFTKPDNWLIRWEGPNGFVETGPDQLNINSIGKYYLTIQDTTSSCIISNSIVIIEENLTLDVALSQDFVLLQCGEIVDIDLAIDADCFEVRWERSDGINQDALATSSFSFDTDGVYTFFVKDCINDCEAERTLVIERKPVSALWGEEILGRTVNFIPEISGDEFIHIWRVGDGNSIVLESPSYTYDEIGTYEVRHEIIDDCEKYTYTKEIVIIDDSFAVPSAAFIYDNQNNDFNFTFEDTSTGEVDSWLWDFGEGNTSTEQNPNHAYAKYGSYEVCLTVTNIVDSDTYCETICVLPDPEQIDLITASDTILNCANVDDGILLFSNILLSDFYNSENWTFNWIFAGGGFSVDNPFLIRESGFFDFNLRDTSSNCSLSLSIEITEDLTTPNFELSTDLDSIPCGSSFELYIDADSSCFEVAVYDENAAQVLISMEDTLTIDGAGYYFIELRDCSSGCISTQQFSIENESITAAWTSEEMGGAFSFLSDQTSGVDHQWDFGDGGISEEQDPEYVYTATGTYQVTHIVSNACGADTLQQSVNVIISSSASLVEGSIQIFPNPASDDLNIRSTVGDISRLKLYTSLGQIQMERGVQASEVQISVSDYAAGVYWLQLELVDGRSWTERVVVLD